MPTYQERSIQTISPRNHVHVFRIARRADIDADFQVWLADAYLVGKQEHLKRQIRLATGWAHTASLARRPASAKGFGGPP